MSHRILIAGLVVGALVMPRAAYGLTMDGAPSPDLGAPLATLGLQTCSLDLPFDPAMALAFALDIADS